MGIEAVMNIGGEQCVQKRRGKRDREVTKSPISITGDEEREEPKQADAAQQEGVISTEGGTFVSHVLCSTTSTRNSSHLQSLYYLPHCITAMHAHPSQQKQKRRLLKIVSSFAKDANPDFDPIGNGLSHHCLKTSTFRTGMLFTVRQPTAENRLIWNERKCKARRYRDNGDAVVTAHLLFT
jgi:hypothetical protein